MNFIQYDFLIPILAFVAVVAVGASILMICRHRKEKGQIKLLEQHVMEEEAAENEQLQKTTFLRFIEKVGNFVSHGHATTTLSEQLTRAGFFSRSAPAIYTGIKMMLFMVGLIFVSMTVIPTKMYIITKITLIFFGGTVLFFIPNVKILVECKKRRREISRHLPEAIDLLEICVSSGIGLDMAWNVVSEKIKSVSEILASTMALSNFEIHLGASRVEAMRHMAARTGVEELSSLAAILVQTERFGTSVGVTLQAFAKAMRDERNFGVEENAEKMAVKLLLPMVLFIFPAVFITIVGPAGIMIAKVMMKV